MAISSCVRSSYVSDRKQKGCSLVLAGLKPRPFFYILCNKNHGGKTMDELKEKLKGFDWYYMFSDDGSVWRKWGAKKKVIMEWAEAQGLTNAQVIEAVKWFCNDHHVVSDWTKK
jgi:hypothetical protein